MSYEWELKHGLNPKDQEDRNGLQLSADGYTNLEMYLDELAGDTLNWKSSTPTPKTRVGDVNGDRKVNTIDYLLMKRYISGTIKDFPAIDDDLWAGDINGDGVIDNTDYVLLRTHILKNEQSFPKEQVAAN